jgi:aryl-alcohol dehydrogenase-like predicted oxidoreductase
VQESKLSPLVESPLILGGHTFISQLGNDPPASEQQQRSIVESCLDFGIRWFDTTYQPERVALGKVLHALGRRSEATILAWNFFTDFAPGDPVGGPGCYAPGHIDTILEQLQTSYVDCLVMVPLDNPEENQQQQELLLRWQKQGYVRSLGLWISDPAIIEQYRSRNSFRYAIRPCNIATDDAPAVFAACKRAGWETLATSPFFRGWELDRMVADATACALGPVETLRPMLADLMLRFTLFHPGVDRVIVAIRKPEWIRSNLASVARGPLTDEEHLLLRKLAARRNRWWRRLLRRLRDAARRAASRH